MFLEGIDSKINPFIKYVKGLLIIIFFHFFGQIPLSLYLIFNKFNLENLENQSEIFSLLPPNLGLFLILIPFLTTLPAIWYVVVKLHNQSFKRIVTSRKKIDFEKITFAFLLWGLISAIMVLSDYFINPHDYELNFKPLSFLILFLIAAFMIPIQTSVEELIFRGYLMQAFGILFKNRLIPLIFTAGIFGILHLWNPEIDKLGTELIWYYIGTGLFLGIITLMDDGIELALGFHAANNLVTAILVTASWTAFQTESILINISEPSLGKELFITLLIIYPILTIIFAKKYQWKNWKKQLFNSFG
ncbi:MAG: CPBP family intramembrane metalloprotease domain-containing protein [Flavobacteriales bacterium]|nr:CPBP family intramembrane metalloprotease domain-containing protein [Flavobacteriales bacterium]